MKSRIFFQWLWICLLCISGGVAVAQGKQSKAITSIQWDEKTKVLVQENAGYGRMIRLHNGNILCGYELAGNSWVRLSKDNGRTWEQAILANQLPYANSANTEVLQLKNGRVLLFYNQRPHDGAHPFAIGYCFSDDNGTTWQKPPKLIYEASPESKNGCWEPAAIQLASGEIQVFFANEFPYQKDDDQEITLMRSLDNGVSWGQPETVSYRAGHRDGMPVPLGLLGHKGIVLAIEDNGLAPGNQLQPAIIHSPQTLDWHQPVVGGNSPRRWGALATPLAGGVYAGAPYIRQLPGGETILSCQSTEGGRTKPQMTVYTGNSGARNFQHKSIPFKLPNDVGGWWNALFIKDANTVTAISSTQINGVSGLWAIDGHIMRGPVTKSER